LRIPPWGFKVVHGIGGGIAENSGSEAALLKAVRIIHKVRQVGGYIFIGLSPLMFLNAVYARISQNTLTQPQDRVIEDALGGALEKLKGEHEVLGKPWLKAPLEEQKPGSV
jgi:predicted SAM-dependent methyltransferase